MFLNKKNIFFNIYSFSLVLVFLKTFSFKFFWNIPTSAFLVLNIVCFVLFMLETKELDQSNLVYIFFTTLIIFLQIFSNNLVGGVGQILNIFVIMFFLLISNERKIQFFHLLMQIYIYISVISLFGWILVYIIKISIPYRIVEFQHYKFYDYYLFNARVEGIAFTRYLGMFIEPGYTGVMNVLLLVGNNFDLKKRENKLLLLCTVFTLSLAAYLLLFIYLFLQMFKSKKVRLFFASVFIFLLIMYIQFGSDDEFLLTRFLFNRIEDMLSGNITGNRFTEKFEILFDTFIHSKKIFLGIGSEFFNTLKLNSCGYKVYIFQFGILNTLLVVLVYFIYSIRYINRNVIVFFIIWVASFVDLGYPTWLCFIFVYFAGISNIFFTQKEIS